MLIVASKAKVIVPAAAALSAHTELKDMSLINNYGSSFRALTLPPVADTPHSACSMHVNFGTARMGTKPMGQMQQSSNLADSRSQSRPVQERGARGPSFTRERSRLRVFNWEAGVSRIEVLFLPSYAACGFNFKNESDNSWVNGQVSACLAYLRSHVQLRSATKTCQPNCYPHWPRSQVCKPELELQPAGMLQTARISSGTCSLGSGMQAEHHYVKI